jgi:predicted CXXCH cytochrome family protein
MEYKLRLDWSEDLCIACHSEKEDMAASVIGLPENWKRDFVTVTKGEGIPSYHKSFLEKKCRSCHIITRDSPERPIVYKMCFQADCHDTTLISGTFKHSETIDANCLLCHSQHGSKYSAHIVNDQQKLCRACHPLLSGSQENNKQNKSDDLHDSYYGLFQELVKDKEITCSFCHGEDHSQKVQENGIATCYQCHNYIQGLVMGKKGRTKNVHETLRRFAGSNCTLCHDPHSSQFPNLLKEERESYQ